MALGQGLVEQVSVGATMDIHVDLSIQEEIESGPDVVEEGSQDIKPKSSDSYRESQ